MSASDGQAGGRVKAKRWTHTPSACVPATPQELGLGGVEFLYVEDSWARNLRFINSDNGALVAYVSGMRCACFAVTVAMLLLRCACLAAWRRPCCSCAARSCIPRAASALGCPKLPQTARPLTMPLPFACSAERPCHGQRR